MVRKYDSANDYIIATCVPIARRTSLGLLVRNGEFGIITAQRQKSDDDLEFAMLREMYFTGGMDACNEDLQRIGEFTRGGSKGRIYVCASFHHARERGATDMTFRQPDKLPAPYRMSDLCLETLVAYYEHSKTTPKFVAWPRPYVQEIYGRRQMLIEKGVIKPMSLSAAAESPSTVSMSTTSALSVPPNGSQAR